MGVPLAGHRGREKSRGNGQGLREAEDLSEGGVASPVTGAPRRLDREGGLRQRKAVPSGRMVQGQWEGGGCALTTV